MFKNLPNQPSKLRSNLSGFFAVLLLLMVLISLIGIISVQQKVRHLETQYAQQLAIQQKQIVKWGRLSLEKSHLSAPIRVEQIAKDKLGMYLLRSNSEQTQVISLLIKPSKPLNPPSKKILKSEN